MNIRYVIAHLLLPITRYEMPGWGRIAKPLGLLDFRTDAKWAGLPHKIVRGKFHGFRMKLDLGNWSQRTTWFLGRFYELDTQMVIKDLVKEGDTFIDVGANIGMITLLASKQVGESGRVFAFEPNPGAYRKLKDSIELNYIVNVDAIQAGLSDTESTGILSVVGTHDGVGSLATPEARYEESVTQRHEIVTKIGDRMLQNLSPQKNLFIKIDVEGYEVKVLKGLAETIGKYRPEILTEIEPAHLERAGSNAAELIDLMIGYGYAPYNISVVRAPIRYECRLTKIELTGIRGRNVLWKPG